MANTGDVGSMSDGFVLGFTDMSHDGMVFLERWQQKASDYIATGITVHLVKDFNPRGRTGVPLCGKSPFGGTPRRYLETCGQLSKPMHLADYHERYDGKRDGKGWGSTKHEYCRRCNASKVRGGAE